MQKYCIDTCRAENVSKTERFVAKFGYLWRNSTFFVAKSQPFTKWFDDFLYF